MSHTVIVEFPCQEGKGAEFLPVLLGALADTRAYEGCESVETYTDADNPDQVILWEKWAQRANQESYIGWRMETGLLDAIGPFLSGPPRIAHLKAED
jgi:quinol monooxygenase YgiN